MPVVTWDSVNKGSGVTLSNGNLTAIIPNRSNTVRATLSRNSGKWYWEIKCDSLSNAMIGIVNSLAGVGVTDNSVNAMYYYSHNGNKFNGVGSAYGASYTTGDIISVLLDLDNGTIEFWKNGVSLGVAFTNVKSLGDIYPAVTSGSSTGGGTLTANFGASSFVYEIPIGYLSYDGSQYGSVDKILILSNDNKVKSLKYINNNTPKMTSNTLPYGEVKASSSYSNYHPYKAFDGAIGAFTLGWRSNIINNQWISYSFPHPVYISKYAIWSLRSGQMPKEFRFEVSNDGINWTAVDKRIMLLSDWKNGDWNYFNLNKIVKAKHFRLYCINNNGSGDFISIPEMQLIGEYNHLIELPSNSEQNFIDYGMDSPVKFNNFSVNKNYILQDGVSENENGYWTTKLDRKPLSIKFE